MRAIISHWDLPNVGTHNSAAFSRIGSHVIADHLETEWNEKYAFAGMKNGGLQTPDFLILNLF